MDHDIEIFRRQYLQLVPPDRLSLPPAEVIRQPDVQNKIYETMFREDHLQYPPPTRYQLRVLKRVVEALEKAVDDPEEDV
jgi:hypothetical protein